MAFDKCELIADVKENERIEKIMQLSVNVPRRSLN